MSSLPVLLRKYKEIYRRYLKTEHELADLDRQILATSSRPAKRRRRTTQVVGSAIREMLRVMREANEPLPPREIASRLNVKAIVVSQRLARAVKLGYVERAGNARYRVADAVPSL